MINVPVMMVPFIALGAVKRREAEERAQRPVCMGNAYVNCNEPADYIRHTQFAGDHPLCEKHAKEDPKFLVSDSYAYWEKLEN